MFIFQFLNGKKHNYVLFNAFVCFIIQKLKNKQTFLKTEKANLRELSFLSFEGSAFIFQILNNEMHKCVKQNILVHFIIQKLKDKHILLKKYRN